MAQLPCIALSKPLTKPAFGSCAIYFHYGVHTLEVNLHLKDSGSFLLDDDKMINPPGKNASTKINL